MDSIGSRLKRLRLEKGLSLEEVHKKTKIHLSIIKAMEEDALVGLSPIYTKGFLKIYCKFLGIDPKECMPDYKEAGEAVNLHKDISASTSGASAFLKTVSIKFSAIKIPEKVRVGFIFILVIVFLSAGFFNLGKLIFSKRKPKAKPERVAVLAKDKVGSKKDQKSHSVKEQAPKKETFSGIRLNIKANENCWVSLKADGKSVFQRILEKGRFESWQAKDKIELSLGNAGAVELEVNGQRFTNLGRKGEPRKNILITKEGLSVLR